MPSLTITIIQTNLHWEDKILNLAMLEEKINSIDKKTEVVVLPEMFSTGFSMKAKELAETMNGETVAWMRRIAAKKKIILTGSLIIVENEQYFNRLIWMLPNGQMGLYDKRHLFAFAGEDQYYTAGNKRLIASVKGWKINLLVCYDLRFPVWSRQGQHGGDEKQHPEYDVLIYVANWPEKRIQMWKTLLQARAIENQSFCIGVNRVGNDGNSIYHSGNSMIVDPLGKVLFQQNDNETIHTITLEKEELETIRHKMPFWLDADPFIII